MYLSNTERADLWDIYEQDKKACGRALEFARRRRDAAINTLDVLRADTANAESAQAAATCRNSIIEDSKKGAGNKWTI